MEFVQSRAIVLFMASHFNMTYQMVKLKIAEAWSSLKDSIYVAEDGILGASIDVLQTNELGATYITPEFAESLAAK